MAKLNFNFSGSLPSRCCFEVYSFCVKTNAAFLHVFGNISQYNFHVCHIGNLAKVKSGDEPSVPIPYQAGAYLGFSVA